MKGTTIGIDLAKQVMHAVAIDESGKELWRKRYRRKDLLAALAQLPPSVVAMGCGGAAHYYGRSIEALGHEAKLVLPQHVTAYRQGNKHDYNDARAIAQASGRDEVRPVPVKTVAEQEVQGLHRLRTGYVCERTALVNQWRGLVAEYGYVMPRGVDNFRRRAPEVLVSLEGEVSETWRDWLQWQLDWLRSVEAQIKDLERALRAHERRDARAGLLVRELAGVGTVDGDGPGVTDRRWRSVRSWT